jgi:peptidoglycan/LPS O-acetylase OafA/YrhL
MIDGNRSREALMQLGGIMTSGEFAVDGFFIVSGYLVLQSFQNSTSLSNYLLKRVRRIYPGFLVCAFLVIGLSPLVGSPLLVLSWRDLIKGGFSIALLTWPDIGGYPGLTFHTLNGSAWSIPYEFRCYLMVVLLSCLGAYRLRWGFLLLTACLLISHTVGWPTYVGPLAKIIGYPQLFIRMAGIFCVGSCFYLFRDVVPYRYSIFAAALAALLASLSVPAIQEVTFAVAGGYLIFWFALGFRSGLLANINSQTDVSYGTYLYAWPITGALIYAFGIRSPTLLFSLALPLSLLAGWLSWHLIERPFLRNKTLQIEAPRSEDKTHARLTADRHFLSPSRVTKLRQPHLSEQQAEPVTVRDQPAQEEHPPATTSRSSYWRLEEDRRR